MTKERDEPREDAALRRVAVEKRLAGVIAELLQLEPSAVDRDVPFLQMGFDSVSLVLLCSELSVRYELELAPPLLFEHPTLRSLAGHLLEAFEAPGVVVETRSSSGSSTSEPIAVIGMSGRYPQAGSVGEYWSNLAAGRDCVGEIPRERWPMDGFYCDAGIEQAVASGRSYCKWGGFVEGITEFDALFFGIAPHEAASSDPQERLFLQCAYETLENAGYAGQSLDSCRGRVGVFVGISTTGYALHGPDLWRRGDFTFPRTSFASVANRVSYVLNLRGPSIPIDTMSSASLTAVHEASQHLLRDECDAAIAGGVNLYVHPSNFIALCAMGVLSKDGRCRSFGHNANGIAPGEAIGAVMLKRLSRAVADGDCIHGLILGTSVNHSGRTSGYSVPSPEAQAELIRAALDRANVHARTVSYIEAHGTGTALGDPIEIAGLKRAFAQDTAEKQFCAIGSVKSNIGHCEGAAGIAGLTKVLLQLQHRMLVPSLHSQELNPYIDFDDSPFVVQRELTPWHRPVVQINGHTREYPRIAGISSFGMGGANAHVVLQEYCSPAVESAVERGSGAAIIVLSAKRAASLQVRARLLLESVSDDRFAEGDLASIAYTLQVGRDAMEFRLGVVVESIAQLRVKLRGYLDGDVGIERLYVGEARRRSELLDLLADEDLGKGIDAWIVRKKYDNLLSLWVQGFVFDWRRLYEVPLPTRVPLPTYPFVGERYWVGVEAGDRVEGGEGVEVEEGEFEAPGGVEGTAEVEALAGVDVEALTDVEKPAGSEALAGVEEPAEVEAPAVVLLSPQWEAVLQPQWAAAAQSQQVLPSQPQEVSSAQRQWVAPALLQPAAAAQPRQVLPAPPQGVFSAPPQRVWVLGGTGVQRAGFVQAHPHSRWLEGVEDLPPVGPLDELVWFAPQVQGCGVLEEGYLEGSREAVLGCYRLIKGLLSKGYGEQALGLTVLTVGAQAVQAGEGVQAGHAGIHGLVGVLAKERVHWRVRLIDVGGEEECPWSQLLRVPADECGEPWCHRHGQWYRQRLLPRQVRGEGSAVYRRGGVYVVVGGAGGLGELLSEHLVRTQAAQVIWLGRRAQDERIRAQCERIGQWGPRPQYVQADACDRGALEQAYEQIRARHGEIHGVVHSAVGEFDESLERMSEERFREVLAVKLDASVRIAQVLGSKAKDFLVFFSSMSSFGKEGGKAGYAAGSVFEDAYGQELAGVLGCAVKVLNWGWWGEVGVGAVMPAAFRKRVELAGVGALEGPEGMRALEQLLGGGFSQLGVVKSARPEKEAGGSVTAAVDGGAQEERLRERGTLMLRKLVAGALKIPLEKIEAGEALEAYGIDSILVLRLTAAIKQGIPSVTSALLFEQQSIQGLIEHFLSQERAALLKWVGLEEGPSHKPLPLGKRIGVSKPAVRKGGSPAVATAGAAPEARVSALTASAGHAVSANSALGVRTNSPLGAHPAVGANGALAWEPIAVIGLSGRYPQARTLEGYWENLKSGRDSIQEIPCERWDLEGFYHPQVEEAVQAGKSYCKWGGFLEGFAEFDALFFNLSPREAQWMDPQERLFMQSCWEVLEDGGYTRERLQQRHGGRVGVFAGITKTGFDLYGPELWRRGESGFPQTSFSSVANRVSYYLDLHGPSMPIDTMCSASLTAIHEGCEHLRREECELAIAGGVNLYLHPSNYVAMCGMQMLSASGRCRSFGAAGDGMVPGEGVGTVLLKRLSAAERDGDVIQGLILGSSINHGGKTNGYTVPNPQAQRELIRGALRKAGVSARQVSYIEAHGTGTVLGDPIEMAGLTQAFEQDTMDRQFCAIGSVKSNIGHAESAAGIAGVTKVLLQMKHGQLVPSLHAEQANPHIDFERTPFVVQRQLAEWPRPRLLEGGVHREYPRIAGVSSFGAGGSNAHVVLQEYVAQAHAQQPHSSHSQQPASEQPTAQQPPLDQPVLVVLSARDGQRLGERVEQLLAALRSGALDAHTLPQIAYTLQVGREAMEHRLALQVRTRAELEQKLTRHAAGESGIEELYRGEVKAGRETLGVFAGDEELQEAIGRWMQRGKYGKLLELWVKGLKFDWDLLYPGHTPRRVSLPTYPFARERFWPIEKMRSANPPEYAVGTAAPATPAASAEKPRAISLGGLDSAVSPIAELVQERTATLSLDSVRQALTRMLADVLFLDVTDVDLDKPFAELGLDSVIGVEWTREISRHYKLAVPAAKIYDLPSIGQFSHYVLGELKARGEPELLGLEARAGVAGGIVLEEPAAQAIAADTQVRLPSLPAGALPSVRGEREDAIAIVGMSARYPGAMDLEEFWCNLAAGKDCVQEIPDTRWVAAEHYDARRGQPGKVYCKWLGALSDVECFDPLFFGISPAEAQRMDPQQRLFLQEGYRAIEDAGYDPRSLSNRKCGVYLGIMGNEYGSILQASGAMTDATGNSASIAASRIAYVLNLKGPAISIDTACSSSLVATHLGCQALRAQEVDLALVGGVTLYLTAGPYFGMCAAGMLSGQGRCKTLDNSADGFVPGEGVGALVLKRLGDARRAGDRIHGVIIGSGINQDGKTNGIMAPNGTSQSELIGDVYERYGVDPQSISYVELHGTGTKLGDPVELGALAEVFKHSAAGRNACALGSVKSNLGHTSAAAGVAGVHKVLLCLRHRELVPTLHFQEPNEHFDFAASPFYVNTQLRPWEAALGRPRRAAVSSFGYSGTNAHVVIEEYAQAEEPEAGIPVSRERPAIIVLSARQEEQLKERARQLLQMLEQDELRPQALLGLAYTLQTGRELLERRVALAVSSIEELKEKLRGYLQGHPGLEGVYEGDTKRARETLSVLAGEDLAQLVEGWVACGEYGKLLELWVKGLKFDWQRLYRAHTPRRVSLPTYPFARERYWAPQSAPSALDPLGDQAQTSYLHPLIHRNTSTLLEQRYTTRFSGDEAVLPGAFLEMAHAAAREASKGLVAQTDAARIESFELGDPSGSDQPRDVHTGLEVEDTGAIRFEIYSDGQQEKRVHARGRLRFETGEVLTAVIDLESLRSSCTARLFDEECLEALRKLRYELQGVNINLLERCEEKADEDTALATWSSRATDGTSYGVAPELLTAVEQAAGLMVGRRLVAQGVAEADIIRPCPSKPVLYLRVREHQPGSSESLVVDVTVCDGVGLVCIRLTAVTTRALSPSPEEPGAFENITLIPRWQTRRLESDFGSTFNQQVAVVVGGEDAECEDIRARFAQTHLLAVDGADTIEDVARALQRIGAIDHVFWLAPRQTDNIGVIECFRLIKALLSLEYSSRMLEWTVVTRGSQAIEPGENVTPAHASLIGLMGSLAKEQLNWRVRVVDAPREGEIPIGEVLRAPCEPTGDPWGYRYGEWYRQRLMRCEPGKRKRSAFRRGGTYVIIGGAGGIGSVFTEHLIRNYRAQVVWLGRREADSAIAREQRRLGEWGPAPIYLRADAANYSSLLNAYRQIRERLGTIQGVVHSAIVLSDRSIANMDEERFLEALVAKVDVSVNLARVFVDEELDFVLFFSSVMSFVKTAGQSNYAAGSTFEDAFAQRLASEWPCRVRIMNWGYWGEQGIVSGPAYRARAHSQGYESIDANAAMAALEHLVEGPFEQLGFVRVAVGKEALGHLPIAGRIAQLPPATGPAAVLSREGSGRRGVVGTV